jgi:hypothetical protein
MNVYNQQTGGSTEFISKFTSYFQPLGSFWVLLACWQDDKPTQDHNITSCCAGYIVVQKGELCKKLVHMVVWVTVNKLIVENKCKRDTKIIWKEGGFIDTSKKCRLSNAI